MSKLDADGDGQISKEELEKALVNLASIAQEAASLFSAVANLFGQRPSQAMLDWMFSVAETEEKKPSEGEVKADEATVEGPKPDENKDTQPASLRRCNFKRSHETFALSGQKLVYR
eukprot:Skav228395  [mRNA]  locus=scaffold1911:94243:95963:+ [translate_table: standard]